MSIDIQTILQSNLPKGDSGYSGISGYSGYSGYSGFSGANAAYVLKTSNYTASSKDAILADTTAGSFTITLPASPSTGDFIAIIDGNSWSTNNLTIARNGSTIEGVADDIALDVSGLKVDLVYDGTTWELIATGGPTIAARGGNGEQVFFENATQVNANYTITSGMNAMSAGPVAIGPTTTITVPVGSRWTIV